MMTNRMKTTIAALAISITAISTSYAADEYNVSKGLTTSGAPLGLHGVDAVALTTLNAVTEGDATHTVVHDGVAYYFASAESAQLFKQSPAKYAPQYGGYCAFAVSLGKKFDGDPNYADIVDGKLYLFVNDDIYRKYKKNSKRILAKAEKTWPSIQNKAVDEL